MVHVSLQWVVCHGLVEVDKVSLSHWAVSSPMFYASAFEARGVVSWCMASLGLSVYCLDVCSLSLHWDKAASSSVSRVSGSTYVNGDGTVVPASGCI